MFGHIVIAALTGLIYLGVGCVFAQTSRVLGPTYLTKVSADWRLRWFFGIVALFFVVRGALFLWPGRLIAVERMSVLAPMEAVIILAIAGYILDGVMRDRAPPPWSVQFLRLLAVVGWDRASLGVAFNTPPAIMGDPLPPPGAPGRTTRLAVQIGAGAVMFAIACLLALSSISAA